MKKPKALKLGWKIFASRYLLQSPFVKVRQDEVQFGSRKFTYTYLEQPGAVFMVPITKSNELILIRIFRYTNDEWCWEVPSGTVGDKVGKDLQEIAKEEMLEECGGSSERISFLGTYYSANGVADLQLHYFLAQDVELNQNQPEEAEQIDRIERVPLDQIEEWVFSGKVNDGDSAFAILLALNHLRKQK